MQRPSVGDGVAGRTSPIGPVLVVDEQQVREGIGEDAGPRGAGRVAGSRGDGRPQRQLSHPGERQALEAAVGPDELRRRSPTPAGRDLGRRTVLQEAAAGRHDGDEVAHLDRLVDVVRHEEDGLREVVLEPGATRSADGRARSGRRRRTARPSAGWADRPRARGPRRRAAARHRRAGSGTGRGRSPDRGRPARAAPCRSRWRAAGEPRRRGTVSTFWPTVRCGNRPTCWMTYPMRRRSSTRSRVATSTPSTRIRPLVGSTSRLTILSDVVLPQPDGPTRTQMRPRAPRGRDPRPRRAPPGPRGTGHSAW